MLVSHSVSRLGIAAGLLIVAAACGGSGPSPAPSDTPAPASAAWFEDRARESGLDFVHFNGMTGEHYYPEIMAPGVALFDFDNDGDLDAYIVQGQLLGPAKTMADATFTPASPPADKLFRNDLTGAPDGRAVPRFTDVTAASGIALRTYGMGVAAADYDNDGFVDLYRTGLDGAVLLHNNGNGTFADVTAQAGVGNPGRWSVSAAFVDIDRDGWLDLFVGNYLQYRLEGDIDCLAVTGQEDYCPPTSYRAQPDRLYRNTGKGAFVDVTGAALVGGAFGPALGVSTADFNGDGWLDIYVGNDGQANQLWINQKNGTFRDTALLAGAALNGSGNAEASMGIDAGDFDNDGDEDLFVTNWLAQMNILYVNLGGGLFEDRKGPSGIGPPSLARTGFGTAWFDYDNDGWLDLLAVNGSVSTIEAQARAKDPFPLRMKDQLYRNQGNGRFEDVSPKAGAVFQREDVGRGAAFGDVDNDGDIDVLIGVASGRAKLLINAIGNANAWVGLRLVGGAGQRDMLGARVGVSRSGAPTRWRRARSDGSYASANDPRVLVGLGTSADPTVRLVVQWPDGASESWPSVATRTWTTLAQGTGQPVTAQGGS